MKIAIQAADLDAERIDGTRVYILNLLKNFGALDQDSEFLIYHKKDFNPELAPPEFSNYKIKKIPFPKLWTQIRFAWEVWKNGAEAIWMPMHNAPIVKRKKTRVAVTIHDLAFKYFPDHFPRKDLWKINLLTWIAAHRADKIIAISESTKKDILKFYPFVREEDIKVVYHGFDAELFARERDFKKEKELKNALKIGGDYVFYCGALQPRKNLETLIGAFEIFKKKSGSAVKLVLAGEKAWLWEGIEKTAQKSRFAEDIIMPGKLEFRDLGHFMRGAGVFVLPSLYEGFGIPILEAMAAQAPVIAARNSSLPEVGGEAALYFESNNASDLAEKIGRALTDEKLRQEMIAKGIRQAQKFSWEKCARETLDFIKA